ncbi:MAG TPA: S1 RNA-binding domain-containing protein, partial [Thermodesulfobacteriota bacterium]|nr:S1 RNA-binding domain-containing protein [Thermodesulfobacteriota bacterium]
NKRIQDCFDKGELIKARVTQKVKGGVIADIGEKIEIRAFIPGSQIDISPRQDLDSLVGETIEARIIKLAGNDIVLSRRAYLEEEREVLRKETLSGIEAGKEISGKVVNIINQGVFVDLGGIEGFIPVSELTWGRVAHPGDVLSRDQIIKTVVLKIDEGGKITLSLKDTTPDPWTSVKEKYKPGSQIKGKAVSITDFGVFVELEPGIEGLVHISEITWTKRFRHPKEIVQAGSPVEAVVLDVDSGNRRISLSLKQIEPSPWQLFKENNPQGSRIKGVIKNVTDKGLFVEVGENIVGLVRPDNISWKGRVNPEESFERGSEIDVVVLNVDDKNQRIGLGLKQLAADPWEEVQKKYKTGRSSVTGKVKEIKDSGIVIELEEGIEGYIRASELSQEKGQRDAAKSFKIGDEITAQVTGFDKRMRQVNLSKRKYDDWQDKERVSNFISSQGEPTAKLGDVLREKLKQINNDEVI